MKNAHVKIYTAWIGSGLSNLLSVWESEGSTVSQIRANVARHELSVIFNEHAEAFTQVSVEIVDLVKWHSLVRGIDRERDHQASRVSESELLLRQMPFDGKRLLDQQISVAESYGVFVNVIHSGNKSGEYFGQGKTRIKVFAWWSDSIEILASEVFTTTNYAGQTALIARVTNEIKYMVEVNKK